MLLLSLIKSTLSTITAFLQRKKAYYELSKVDPYLLEDMGLKLENGVIINLREQQLPVVRTSDAVLLNNPLGLVIDNDRSAEALAVEPLEPPPVGSRG